MDHYVRINDEGLPSLSPPPAHRKLIIAYACQFILYALVIAYCILSPSLFSTISIAFILVSFLFMLATPYRVTPAHPLQSNPPTISAYEAVPYSVELCIMSVFTLFNIGVLLFKIYMAVSPGDR